MVQQRLPAVNSDDGIWGDILRQYLMKEHYNDDTDNAVNGGHQKVTIRAGTASAGTAPLKFTSGTLLTTPEAGAIEFLSDKLYFTQTTSTTRKTIAAYDDASGATGDVYYRNSGGSFVRLGIGSTGDMLTVSGGIPAWSSTATAGLVSGPASATDNAITRYDGTTGKLIQNSAATVDDSGNLTAAGIIATGGFAGGSGGYIDSTKIINVDHTVVPASDTYGLFSVVRQNASTSNSNYHFGAYIIAQVKSGNAQNYTGGLRGANIIGEHAGSGTVSQAYGLETTINNTSSGTISSAAGLHINAPTNSGGGTLTSYDGILIDAPTAAGTNRALRTTGGDVILNDFQGASNFTVRTDNAGTTLFVEGSTDRVGIGTGSPQVKLDVSGEIRASTAGTNAASVVTVGGTQTLTNKTLTDPKIDTTIKDINGNTILSFSPTASAVNYLQITNQQTGYPSLVPLGSETNIGLTIVPKGGGNVNLYGATGQTTQSIVASGTATNIDLDLGTKGSGVVTANGVAVATISGTQTLTNKTLTSPVINTSVSGSAVATAATASTLALRDANANLTANAYNTGFTTTATAAGTTTLTIASTGVQVFTGSTTQTVKLPTTSVIAGGQYTIINQSSGVVTVQSSGANTITAMAANTTAIFTALVATPTTAANWSSSYATAGSSTFSDTSFTLQDNGDATKQLQFELSGITTSTTRTLTVPNANTTIVGTDATQTLTNKTITAPKIDAIVDTNGVNVTSFTTTASAVNYLDIKNNSTTLSPTITATGTDSTIHINMIPKGATGRLNVNGVNVATTSGTFTLTNKTIDLASNTITGTTAQFNTALSDNDFATLAGTETFTNKTLTDPKVNAIKDTNGNTALNVIATASAVNYIALTNNVSGFAGVLQAAGSDANLDLALWSKGTGVVKANNVEVTTISGTQTLTNKTLTTPVLNGIPTGTGVATAATASTLALRDTSGNLLANNIGVNSISTGFTTTATAAGTTTLTISSTGIQVFTGSSTQTVKLPTTSVTAGGQYTIINQSTGAVTVQSSGSNTITILAGSTSATFTAVIATPTTAANWASQYLGGIVTSGKSLSVSNTLTLAGTDATTMTFPSTSGNVVTEAFTQTLTNKTISGSSNTLLNTTGMLLSVQACTLNNETFTIAAGSVTQISGTSINGGSYSPSVGDRILITGAPSSSGSGTAYVNTTNPANGIYTVTSNTTNLSLSRSSDMSGSVNPAGLTVFIQAGAWNSGNIFSVITPTGTGAFTYGSGNIGWQATGGYNPTFGYIYMANSTNTIGIWNGSGNTYVQPSGSAGNQTLTLPATATSDTLVGRASTDTLTNKTLTTPKIDSIKDANGNTILGTNPVASAVNYVLVQNAPTGGGVAVMANGSDTNINFYMAPKGLAAVGIFTASGTTPTIFADGVDTNLDLNFLPKGTGKVKAANDGTYREVTTISGTQTLTNKRIQQRTGSTTSSATPTINSDNVDLYQITALATNITSMTTNLSGTPTAGQQLLISIKDDGSARTIAWGASYVSTGVGTLPTTTVAGKIHWIGLTWDGSKWACLASDAVGY